MNPTMLYTLAAMSLVGAIGGTSARARERRPTTLDEEEAMSVRRMMRRWQKRERARIAREAAEAEERRPKSRQELRARARDRGVYRAAPIKPKPKSSSLERLLRKRR